MDSGLHKNIVLIINPERDRLKGTKSFLKSHGYVVKTATLEGKALKKAFSEKPQVVLLGAALQGIAREELVRSIKQLDPRITIITNGNTTVEEAGDLKKLGVDYFLKPTDLPNLLTILKETGKTPAFEEGKKWGMEALLEKFLPFWAHEIRNPLQAIGGAINIIERRSNVQDMALAQSINIVKEEVQTLTDFVQECLDYIKPPNRSHWGEININETLILVLNLMPLLLKGLFENVSVSTQFDPQLPKVYANYEEIKKVFTNIIKNGFEAMSKTEKKELTIQTVNKTKGKDGWVEIIVRDSGEGIKKEHIESVGTPFFTTKLRGTGMGLVICNRIIGERHNGRLSIEGEENMGTTVTIQLPIAQETAARG
jgi:signal transduction histidine kinase